MYPYSRMVEVAQHPNITLYTYSELESVEGLLVILKPKSAGSRKVLMKNFAPDAGYVPPNVQQKDSQ